MNGNGNFFGQYRHPSQMGMNMGYGNFNNAFNGGPTMMQAPRHTKPKLVHDNVYDDVLYEQISDHVIFIQSRDRDTTIYRDPLSLTVNFSSVAGTPEPIIDAKFKNVKYVNLNSITLPVYTTWTASNLSASDFLNDNNTALDFTKVVILKTDGTEVDLESDVLPTLEDDSDSDVTIEANRIVEYINRTYIQSDFTSLRSDGTNISVNDSIYETEIVTDDSDFSYSSTYNNTRTNIDRIYRVSDDRDFYFDPSITPTHTYQIDGESATYRGGWRIMNHNENSTLFDDTHITISIRELESEFVHGTNRILDNCYGITRPSKQFNTWHFYGTSHLANRIFREHLLGDLRRMTLKFYDSSGSQITLDHISSEAVREKDPRHPLSFQNQMQISFLVGVVEPTINQRTKYEQ